MGERICIFDAMKVLAIVMVVIHHIPLKFTPPFDFTVHISYVGSYGIGMIGVVIFFLVSGCVLEIAYGEREYSLADFYEKRILRLYPAFWLSLLFAAIVAPQAPQAHLMWKYATEFFGVSSWFNIHDAAMLNPVCWFVGAITVLYILYPFLSRAIREYPAPSMLSLLLINLEFNYLSLAGAIDITQAWYFLPFGHLFIFSLGILIAQAGYYPKAASGPALAYAADLSFYIFLVHMPLTYLWSASPVAFVFASIGAAVVLQQMDRALQTRGFPAINAWGEQRRLAREARPPGIRT